jgi:hypothetical protein
VEAGEEVVRRKEMNVEERECEETGGVQTAHWQVARATS